MNGGAAKTVPRRVLVLGYGNPARGDDGLGPALIGALAEIAPQGVTVESGYQLNIEDAADAAEHDVVLFVDASTSCEAPFAFTKLAPAREVCFTSHSVSPASLLGICDDYFDARPDAYALAIRGYAFEPKEEISAAARRNLEEATKFIEDRLGHWKDGNMEQHGAPRKTILIIDDDPDIRAALRIVLEAEGFTVGQATSGEEGLKIAQRIQPDAVVVDLMMEQVDSGTVLSRKLKDSGYGGPIYMLSSAGDTVRYNLDARDLGLAGIFQKPVDPKALVGMLRKKLAETTV